MYHTLSIIIIVIIIIIIIIVIIIIIIEILFYSSEDDSFGAFSILFFLLFSLVKLHFLWLPPPHNPHLWFHTCGAVVQRKILNL